VHIIRVCVKNLVFIGSDNIGDAFLTYQIIDAISYNIPDISVYLYHKNHFQTKAFFEKHPNIKSIDVISTKVKLRT
jgi:ADP-heptose:LPS heptosyltransferase